MGACCSKNMQVEDGADNKSHYKRAHSYSHPKTEKSSLLAQSSAAEMFERAEADSILPPSDAVKAALIKDTADISSPDTGTTCECDDNASQTNMGTESVDEITAFTHTQFQASAATGSVSPNGSCVPLRLETVGVNETNGQEVDNAVTTYVYGLLTNRRTNQSTPAKIPVRMPMTSRSSYTHQQPLNNIQSCTLATGEESTKSNMSRTTLLPISEADVVTENNMYINLGNISPNASPSHYMPPHMFLTARSHVGNHTRREYNFGNMQQTGPQHFRIGTVDSCSHSDASEWHRITSQDSSEWDFEFWENFDASAFEVAENTTNKMKPHALIPVLNMELVAALRASENGFSPIAANVNSFKPIPGLISGRTTCRDGHANVHTPAHPLLSHAHTYMPASMATQRSAFLDHDTHARTHAQQHNRPAGVKQVMFAHSNTMPNLSSQPANVHNPQTNRHVTGVLKSSNNHAHNQDKARKGSQTQRVPVFQDTDAHAVEKIRKLATSRHTNNPAVHAEPHAVEVALMPISQTELFEGIPDTPTHTLSHKSTATARDFRGHIRKDVHLHTLTARDLSSANNYADTQTLTVASKDEKYVRDSSPQPPVAEERVRDDSNVFLHDYTDTDSYTGAHKSYTHRNDLVADEQANVLSLASKALSTHRRGGDLHYTQMYARDPAAFKDEGVDSVNPALDDKTNGDSMSSEGSLAWTSLHTASMGRMGSQDTGMSFCSTQSSCVPAEEDQQLKQTQKHAQTNSLNGLVTSRRQPNILMDTVEEEEMNKNNAINAAITTR